MHPRRPSIMAGHVKYMNQRCLAAHAPRGSRRRLWAARFRLLEELEAAFSQRADHCSARATGLQPGACCCHGSWPLSTLVGGWVWNRSHSLTHSPSVPVSLSVSLSLSLSVSLSLSPLSLSLAIPSLSLALSTLSESRADVRQADGPDQRATATGQDDVHDAAGSRCPRDDAAQAPLPRTTHATPLRCA